MKKDTIIYYDGGDNYKGRFNITSSERKQWHKKAKENSQIGYLTGYHYRGFEKDGVICYFREQPSLVEIENRRSNGFIRVTWYWL